MSISNIVDSTAEDHNHHVLPTIGLIVSAQFSVHTFTRRWSHCSQLANFLARFISANELDPERQSMLLSTFFNEVLEIVYRNQSGVGQIKLGFRREGKRLHLRVEVPVDDVNRQFYHRAVELVNHSDLGAWYMNWLEESSEGGIVESNEVGLIELAAAYSSGFNIIEESKDGSSLLLAADFPYESEDTE